MSSLISSKRGNAAAKCELFCLKCLKACIDVSANSKDVPNGYKDVIDILIDSLVKYIGSNNRIPELSCEKVLLHVVKEYCIKKCYNEQLKIAQLLQTLLHKTSDDQVTCLHKNITDLLVRTCSQLNNSLLCLKFRQTAILSMINAKCSEQVVVDNIVNCSNWYQMTSTSSRPSDLLTFYGELDKCLPQNVELANMAVFLCHYCKICYDNNEENLAEKCLERLSILSVDHSSSLKGLVTLIRTCYLIDTQTTTNGGEDDVANSMNKALVKLNVVRKPIQPAVTFVMEWLNELLTSISSTKLFNTIKSLEEKLYLPFVCDQKKIIVYKMLLNLLFAQVKLIIEEDGRLDDKLLHQSTELVMPLINKAENCCHKLGQCTIEHINCCIELHLLLFLIH